MKKPLLNLIALMLTVIMIICFASCSGGGSNNSESEGESSGYEITSESSGDDSGSTNTTEEQDSSGNGATTNNNENDTPVIDEPVPLKTSSSIIGTWISERIPFSKLLKKENDLTQKLSNIYISFAFTFKDDGTALLNIREKETQDEVRRVMEKYYDDALTSSAESSGKTKLSIVQQYGYKSVDKYIEDFGSFFDDFYDVCNYDYLIEDGKLYIRRTEKREYSDYTGYFTASASSKELTLSEYNGEPEFFQLLHESNVPITFTKK